MRSCVPVLASLLVTTVAFSSVAQEQPSADLRGTYAPLHHDAGLAIEPADSPELGQITASVRAAYAFRPVVLRAESGEIAHRVIEHQFTADVGFAVGLFGRLTLGLDLPLLMGQVGDDLTQAEEAQRLVGEQPIALTSLGDPGLRAKITIVKPSVVASIHRGFALAVDERFSLPLGDERSFIAEGGVASETRVLAEYGFGVVGIHLAAGAKFRESTASYACDPDEPASDCLSRFGHELPWVAGLVIHPHHLGIDPDSRGTLFIEARGHFSLEPVTLADGFQASQAHASVAGRYRAGDVALLGALEVGLGAGVGTAPFRAMLGVSFAPRAADADGDGLVDSDDKCPSWKEDADGFEQDDGCPEMDNDGDGVPDSVDPCPNVKGPGGANGQGCPS